MKKVLSVFTFIVVGALFGGGLLWTIGFDNLDKMNIVQYVIGCTLMGLGVYGIIILTTIIHEFGHLVCGLMSGYKYLNFRVLSFNFCKYDDGFKIKRFTIPGTGGQCLMAPPEYNEGDFKYKLYLMGGNMATFILLALEVLLVAVIGIDLFVGRFILLAAVIATYLFLLNVIPMKVGGIANDAYDIKNLGKNLDQKKEFWNSLDVNARNHNGVELSDMGIDYDAIDDDQMLNDIDGIAIQIKLNIKVNYLIYMKRFEEAYSLCKKLLDKKEVLELYKCELRCDKMFLEIMLGKDGRVKKTYSDSVKQYINKTHKFMLQRMRLMYAYYLLIEKDEAKALEEKKCFDNMCPRYPDLGEIKSERKLMEYIEAIHSQCAEGSIEENIAANIEEKVAVDTVVTEMEA